MKRVSFSLAVVLAAVLAAALLAGCEKLDRDMYDSPAFLPQEEPVRLPPRGPYPPREREASRRRGPRPPAPSGTRSKSPIPPCSREKSCTSSIARRATASPGKGTAASRGNSSPLP